MSNGDDGYSNGGGGGSVWWEVAVSEGKIVTNEHAELLPGVRARCPDRRFKPHKEPRAHHDRYMITGHDKFREVKDDPNRAGYFEIRIPEASEITHVELDGDELKIYLPIQNTRKKVEQYRVTWGMRPLMKPTKVWKQLRAVLRNLKS